METKVELAKVIRTAADEEELLGFRTLHAETLPEELTPMLHAPDIRAFCDDVGQFIRDLAKDMRNAKDAKEALKVGFDQLESIDRKRFVISNAIEGLKRGEKLPALVKRFEELGLFEKTPQAAAAAREPREEAKAGAKDVADFTPKSARFFQWLDQQLRRGARIAVTAIERILKTIPELVEVKFGIAIVGGIPVPTLQFDDAGVSVQQLFDMLAADG